MFKSNKKESIANLNYLHPACSLRAWSVLLTLATSSLVSSSFRSENFVALLLNTITPNRAELGPTVKCRAILAANVFCTSLLTGPTLPDVSIVMIMSRSLLQVTTSAHYINIELHYRYFKRHPMLHQSWHYVSSFYQLKKDSYLYKEIRSTQHVKFTNGFFLH